MINSLASTAGQWFCTDTYLDLATKGMAQTDSTTESLRQSPTIWRDTPPNNTWTKP